MVEGIAQNQIYTVGVLAAGVAAVVGAMAWIDGRVHKAITAHTEVEMERHKLILEKISNLHDLMQTQRTE